VHENVSKMRIESKRLTDVFDRADKANRMSRGVLKAAEKLRRVGKKRQGTTSVVPQVP
jgi:hypothetical protein